MAVPRTRFVPQAQKVLQAWAEACVVLPVLYLQPTNNSTPALGNKANKQEVAKVVTSYNS